jgi:hypothetical protein
MRPGEHVADRGLMADFVTDETREAVLAEREQNQNEQRTHVIGLAL